MQQGPVPRGNRAFFHSPGNSVQATSPSCSPSRCISPVGTRAAQTEGTVLPGVRNSARIAECNRYRRTPDSWCPRWPLQGPWRTSELEVWFSWVERYLAGGGMSRTLAAPNPVTADNAQHEEAD